MSNPILEELTDYPFARLRALLQGLSPDSGLEPLVMSIGEPQMQPPSLLHDVFAQNTQSWNRYPPMAGTEELRHAIGYFLDQRYGLEGLTFDALKQVMPVNGTREGLFMLGMLCLNQQNSDKPIVLMPTPFYQVYHGASVMNNAETYFCPANEENGFQPDYEKLPEDILAKTQLAYICSPANPQGALMGLEQMTKQLELARQYGFTLVIDECYSEIYREHTRPAGGLDAARKLGGSLDHLLIVNSLSKRSSAAGLRSGFIAGDQKLIELLLRLRNYGGAVLPTATQAVSAALWKDEMHVKQMRHAYNKKFEIAADILSDWPHFTIPQGGFFLWLPVKDDEQAAKYLWQKQSLRVLPGRYLSHMSPSPTEQQYIRIALVHEDRLIHEGLTRLRYCMDAII